MKYAKEKKICNGQNFIKFMFASELSKCFAMSQFNIKIEYKSRGREKK